KLLLGHERAGCAAKQDRLEAAALRQPARFVDERAQRGSHGDLVDARRSDMPGQAEQSRARRLGGAGGRERSGAVVEDVEDVDQRLHVVDQRRPGEKPRLDRERRLVARLTTLALDGVEKRRLLAAYVRARASAHLDVKARAGGRDVVAEEAAFSRLLYRAFHA